MEPEKRRSRSRVTVLIAFVAVVFLFAPATLRLIGFHATEFENRPLKPRPSLTDGWGMFTNAGPWATDHLPGRKQAVRANESISEMLFGDGAAEAAPQVKSPFAPYPLVIDGKDGYFFYGGDIGMKCKPVTSVDAVTQALTRFDAAVTASGRQLVVVSPPDKSTMLPQFLPDEYLGKDCAETLIASAWPQLAALPFFIDLRQPLRDLEGRYDFPIYMPKDSHWDGPAAATMVESLIKAVDPASATGLSLKELTSLEITGDMATITGRDDKVDWHVFTVLRQGMTGRIGGLSDNLKVPQRVMTPPQIPTIIAAPTIILGDSFMSVSATPLEQAFGDLTFVHHESTQGPTQQDVIKRIVASKVVVVEMVERDLISGNSPIVYSDFLGHLEVALAANPVR